MKTYLVQIRYIPEATERRLAARPAHRAFLTELHDAGKLIDAGPTADQLGAYLIYRCADVAELSQIRQQDPYPADSYETVSISEWLPLFS